MTTIKAETVLMSRNAASPDKVLSTLLLRYPRCIHAEFMTHRLFSRNAASSRAIPVPRLIQDVLDDPFVPLVWGKNQPGMSAREGLAEGPRAEARVVWENATRWAVEAAREMHRIGAHKQIVNRLLEPFAHITVVVSATDWSNFLALRDHPDAEPHIAMLARAMRRCLDQGPVQDLDPGEWHLPFITESEWSGEPREDLIKKSVARCASTSYKTVEGFDMTTEKAVALHDKLLASKPLHASPFEHAAIADYRSPSYLSRRGSHWAKPEMHGNFDGFIQYRKMLKGERL